MPADAKSDHSPLATASHRLPLLYAALALLLTACGGDDEPGNTQASASATNTTNASNNAANSAQVRAYEVIVASAGENRPSISLGGTVIPKTELTVRAQAPGRVVFIVGDEGTAVEKGQTVIDLDEKNLIAQRRAAEAGLERAQAQLQNAYIQLDQNIISDGVNTRSGMGMPQMFDYFVTRNMGDMFDVGDSDYDRYASIYQSRTAVEQAKSAVTEAESRIEQIDAMFRDKIAISPGDAIVLEKMVELGDAVQPGQPLIKIGDISRLQVQLDVPARLLDSIQLGMTIPIHVDVTGIDTTGKVIRIFPSADAERHTTRIKIALPPGVKAAPGMYATAAVPDIGSNSATSVNLPKSAIVWRGSQASIYVVDQNGRALLRMVRTGFSGGEFVTVLSGLAPGDRVIAKPDARLRSGDMIQVTAAPSSGALWPSSVPPTPPQPYALMEFSPLTS